MNEKHVSTVLGTALGKPANETPTTIERVPLSSAKVREWEDATGFETLGDQALLSMLEFFAAFMRALESRQASQRAGGGMLTLIGPSGIGKTHLGKWASRWAYANHLSQWFARWDRTVDQFRNREIQGVSGFADPQLLIIDDTGAETSQSQFSTGILKQILDTRIDAMNRGKFTLMTTNLRLEEWKDADPRVESRIRRGNFLTVSTEDYFTRKRTNPIA